MTTQHTSLRRSRLGEMPRGLRLAVAGVALLLVAGALSASGRSASAAIPAALTSGASVRSEHLSGSIEFDLGASAPRGAYVLRLLHPVGAGVTSVRLTITQTVPKRWSGSQTGGGG